jgi:hypothetical protein
MDESQENDVMDQQVDAYAHDLRHTLDRYMQTHPSESADVVVQAVLCFGKEVIAQAVVMAGVPIERVDVQLERFRQDVLGAIRHLRQQRNQP